MKVILNSLAMSLIITSCGVKDETSESKSIVSTSARWANPGAIPVCWENPGQASQEIRDTIKAKVIAEYHNKTNVRFTRFDNCGGGDFSAQMIRVRLNPVHNWSGNGGLAAGGGVSWLGPVAAPLGGNGGQGTMRIDIGTSGQYPPTSNGLRQFAIDQTLGTAVHEFGHAIGLFHEQDRTDSPNCNDQPRQKAGGNVVYVGGYDPASIMNYCKQNNINSLTAGDAAGVNFLYPNSTVPANALAGEYYLKPRHSDKCVDVAGASKEAGGNVHQWTCNQTGAQRFRFLPAGDGTYSIQNVNSGMCLDADGANDGANIRQWHCAGVAHQRMRLKQATSGRFLIQFVHSNKCVDVGGALRNDGANVRQWACGMGVANEEYELSKI